MPADIRDPDFEPEWLWGTRVTAEAARAARVESRTSQERFKIYERLILAACEARKRRDVPNTVANYRSDRPLGRRAELAGAIAKSHRYQVLNEGENHVNRQREAIVPRLYVVG